MAARTPITVIMGFNSVNQLTDDLGREQCVDHSEIVARNCEHLLALINNDPDIAHGGPIDHRTQARGCFNPAEGSDLDAAHHRHEEAAGCCPPQAGVTLLRWDTWSRELHSQLWRG